MTISKGSGQMPRNFKSPDHVVYKPGVYVVSNRTHPLRHNQLFLAPDMTADREKYMRRCLQLALNGAGATGSNPMVGAVLVHGDRIIGEGYHQRYGEAHAEVN